MISTMSRYDIQNAERLCSSLRVSSTLKSFPDIVCNDSLSHQLLKGSLRHLAVKLLMLSVFQARWCMSLEWFSSSNGKPSMQASIVRHYTTCVSLLLFVPPGLSLACVLDTAIVLRILMLNPVHCLLMDLFSWSDIRSKKPIWFLVFEIWTFFGMSHTQSQSWVALPGRPTFVYIGRMIGHSDASYLGLGTLGRTLLWHRACKPGTGQQCIEPL
ncbi:hypothetical protein GWK47_014654 [Chionoecetes opilio]|uniref:Uncharacterized protein n=1 Tax=Chionoecetes opilio TaxID=41210 RepID=A0A8J4XY17_CHIOP|nr:hypothetical protein GWK47_014654 [Chionoecetes opilio]